MSLKDLSPLFLLDLGFVFLLALIIICHLAVCINSISTNYLEKIQKHFSEEKRFEKYLSVFPTMSTRGALCNSSSCKHRRVMQVATTSRSPMLLCKKVLLNPRATALQYVPQPFWESNVLQWITIMKQNGGHIIIKSLNSKSHPKYQVLWYYKTMNYTFRKL